MVQIDSACLLRGVLDDPESKTRFEAFLKRQYAWENLGFYLAVEKFKKLPAGEEQAKECQTIFDTFLRAGVENELGDVNREIREMLADQLQKPSADMFGLLQAQVFHILAQSTVRDYLRSEMTNSRVPRSKSSPMESSKKKRKNLSMRLPLICRGSSRSVSDNDDEPCVPVRSKSHESYADGESAHLDGEVADSLIDEPCKPFESESGTSFGFLSLVQSSRT